MNSVQFPEMRREVARALASLADLEHQRRAWLGVAAPMTGLDNLTLCINILYDDTQVLPNPTARIGSVLVEGEEIDALSALSVALEPLIDRLGDASDSEYVGSPEWLRVVQLASVSLAAIVRADG